MAPSPQGLDIQNEAVSLRDGNQVVISGMSGLYPSSRYVRDLDNILYNKINPIKKGNIRWQFDHPYAPKYSGNIPELDRFDSQFFSVHYRLAVATDPMARKVLEQAYEAIYDAGVCPETLSGKKIGVYIGSCLSESEKAMFYDTKSTFGFAIVGCNKSMFANRISYWLNLKSPSLAIDDSDCSSSAALELACNAILRGDCEAAIVGATNLSLYPQTAVHIGKLMNMSQDGTTRSYSADASGYVKSEAISVLFLQRAKDAVRIYADVLHAHCGYLGLEQGQEGPLYGYYRDPEIMAAYLKNFYDSVGVPPSVVEYVEGFGSANPKADKAELEAFDKVFCNNRDEPLLVGSVMSNIGHAETVSGISAIIKVILGYHHGELAGNLNCENPRNDVAGLKEGRIELLNDHRKFRRSYVAVNNMSVTGINAHILLNGHYKPKDLNRYKTNIPRLVTISGRKDTSVQRAFEELKSHPIDPEELALLQNIHETRISGHLGRGFVLLDTVEEQTVCLLEKVDTFDDAQRPLWFVYSGMGSQWTGMGAQLMQIPIFAAAIERCHQVLAPKGLDIAHIITSPDKSMFDNILHSFVGIAAVQIGLTDVLRELGLVPDNIIGHSVGELGCAYADGCMTAEEMILSAYSRGLVSLETSFIKGSMAAVGLGFHQVSKMCPPEIEIACHNSSESCTISGPAEEMKNFVSELVAKGIFAREVPCSNIAYHSRYIAKAGPKLLKYLQEVIKTPRERSKRWVSTSVSQDKWDGSIAKFSSPEYHTNNLLSPVLFEETSRLIPNNAVVVEVAPHGLLQAILKRSLPKTCTNIPLTRRGHKDGVQMLLEAVGLLYMSGYHPKIQVLYPKIEFPVSTGTPFLSHYVDWAHHDNWTIPLFKNAQKKVASICKFILSVHDDEYSYLKGHVVGNKTLIPFAFALVAVWDTLAMTKQIPKKKLSVKFSDIHFYAQPELFNYRFTKLTVSLLRGSGYFEIMNEESRIAAGYINVAHTNESEKIIDDYFEYKNDDTHINGRDVYQILYERGYNYSDQFRSIHSITDSLDEAQFLWNDNWVTLLDGMLQLNALQQPHNSISLVTQIRSIYIDVNEHTKYETQSKDGNTILKAHVNDVNDLTRCGGILMHNLQFRELPVINAKQVVLKTIKLYEDTILNGEYQPLKGNRENVNDIMLQSEVIGDLDSLKWVQTPKSAEDGLSVKVQFAGIHMNDFKKAAGVNYTNFAESSGYGLEFSGLTESGDRVMGLVENGSVRSVVTAQPEFLWPVPSHWSMEDAATVPLAYAMAFYCLDIKSSVRMGIKVNSVLVHGGAGALGQAVIAVGLAKGYRMFTTVSDLYKKKFLLKLFPTLNEDDIGNSRDASFADMVLSATNGEGCDIVICSVEGELKNVSLKCCAPYGLSFDTTQIYNKENFSFGMNFLTFCRTYFPLDITSIFSNPQSKEVTKIQMLVSEGIALGYVRPLSRVTYEAAEAPRAFRLLAGRQHRGRVLLKLQDQQLPVRSRLLCPEEGSHIIFCDTQPLGPQIADMLISSGAKKLHLHIPQPTPFLRFKQRVWNKKGIQVSISSEVLQDDAFSNIMNSVSNSTPIDGVHIASNNVLDPELLTKLDLTTRKLCKSLKYFSVFTNGQDAQCIALERTRNKLPITVVNLSMLDTIKDEEGLVWYQGIKEAAEEALQSSHPLLSAQSEDVVRVPLVQQIAALAGKCIPEDVNDDTELQGLGIEEEKSQIISAFLRDAHNISIDEKQIPTLSVGSVKQIERRLIETKFEDVEGLGAIFTYVDPDELMATTDMVAMPTLTDNLASENDEINVDDSFLFIIPGLEGLHERFTSLCERLKLNATVLQPGIDNSHETVQELAARYSKVVQKISGTKEHFHLLGFEAGVFAALELAAILEQKGRTGTVFCIGEGPAETKIWIQEKIRQYTFEEELQTGILLHILKLMSGDQVDSESLMKELKRAESWEIRVDACVRTLLKHVSYSMQYARGLVQSAYNRILSTINYTPNLKPLKSQIVLLRSSNSSTSSTTSLQSFSEQPVIVHNLETPLVHSMKNMRCAALINRYLPKEILETFENKVLCDTYLLNPDIL